MLERLGRLVDWQMQRMENRELLGEPPECAVRSDSATRRLSAERALMNDGQEYYYLETEEAAQPRMMHQ